MTQIVNIPRTKAVLDGTEKFAGQDAAGGTGSSFQTTLNSLLNAPLAAVDHTLNFTLTSSDLSFLHTNVGAAGSVTASLPAAESGLTAYFYCDGLHNLILDPTSTETIGLQSTYTLTYESLVILTVLADGNWTFNLLAQPGTPGVWA